jgi:20S proteasome subunit beta 7
LTKPSEKAEREIFGFEQQSKTRKEREESERMTLTPTVTGASVVACKFKNGVIIACDTLGSYGSLARFKDLIRIVKCNSTTLMAYDGEVSDFQQIQEYLRDIQQEDGFHEDGLAQGPKDVLTHFARMLYQRRSKMNPLWNSLVVGGWDEIERRPFLGTTDMIGTMFEEDVVATGLGMHMALPMLRAGWRPDLTEEEARELVTSALRVLFYRDCYSSNKITFSVMKSDAVPTIEPPVELSTEWSYRAFVKPPT